MDIEREFDPRAAARLQLGPFRFTSTTVQISGKPEIDQWLGPLQFALWAQRASPWWIGDLLNAGDARFGEAFSQACQGLISADMLQRYESVARKVPPSVRRDSLSWSAHAAVARLPHDQQRRMLALAEKNGWTSEQLRVHVRDLGRSGGGADLGAGELGSRGAKQRAENNAEDGEPSSSGPDAGK